MQTIAIVGPGAVGGVLAGWLTKAGRSRLTLCARRALSTLTVETLAGLVVVRATVVTDASQATPVTGCSSRPRRTTRRARRRASPALVGEQTRIAVLQNGVEHRERFRRRPIRRGWCR
jgi:2-dehydropantoate 2-reductase